MPLSSQGDALGWHVAAPTGRKTRPGRAVQAGMLRPLRGKKPGPAGPSGLAAYQTRRANLFSAAVYGSYSDERYAHCFSPKGWNKTAQGNALGPGTETGTEP